MTESRKKKKKKTGNKSRKCSYATFRASKPALKHKTSAHVRSGKHTETSKNTNSSEARGEFE